jgi:hypothetical protein
VARLGSLLGGILAEVARARLIADGLTRDLVNEYESDPVLASLSVPRVVVSEATVALRFTVQDLEEASPLPPDVGAVRVEWPRHAVASALPNALVRLGLTETDRDAVLAMVDTPTARPTAAEVREALAGRPGAAASATARPISDAWTKIPPAVRRRLGSKTAFRRRLDEALAEDLMSYLEREASRALVRAALASKLDVAIRRDELPVDPTHLQEIRLTLRGEDLDVIAGTKEI